MTCCFLAGVINRSFDALYVFVDLVFICSVFIAFIYWLAQFGGPDVVLILIERGADVNRACPNNGMTPLYVALRYGHDAVAKLLRNSGAAFENAYSDKTETYCMTEPGFSPGDIRDHHTVVDCLQEMRLAEYNCGHP
jgi:ankyrin repeat protein